MVWNQSKFGFRADDGQNWAGQDCDSVSSRARRSEINVLASQASWAWPAALREIFRPRGVNLLVAEDASEFVSVIRSRRIHTTIIDVDSDKSNALATIRIIRMDYPLMPCILLSSRPRLESRHESLLEKALRLNVFSVIDKPVDMGLLLEQLNRLFMRRYDSDIFSR